MLPNPKHTFTQRSRLCVDPGGLGFSSPSPEPQDTIHETEDVEEALKGAHLDGPYVMAAHSAGAYVAIRSPISTEGPWSE